MANFSKKGIRCQIFEFLINKRLDFRIYIRTHDEGSCTVEDFQKGPYRRRCLFYNFVLHAIREICALFPMLYYPKWGHHD